MRIFGHLANTVVPLCANGARLYFKIMFSFKAVGCDHILESGTRKDRCGICDGDGDSCILEKSAYTKDYRVYGESLILPPKYNSLKWKKNYIVEYMRTHYIWIPISVSFSLTLTS